MAPNPGRAWVPSKKHVAKRKKTLEDRLGRKERIDSVDSDWLDVCLPPKDAPKITSDRLELTASAYTMFKDLNDEREVITKAVASLATVKRKGGKVGSVLELDEEAGVED
ncbi:hypothetical protein GGX14DRAFT_572679 [Mycena pura]|uniref:Uncharacterized protein n=1 Tax=Mycena pura TaxID=153505 RepID=A0AAD6YAQ7_9AGAR|nr:hypothetical protein GGX14DRAFT_572679 [Mycena pura]